MGIKYDEKRIEPLLNNMIYFDYDINYLIFQLLNDSAYLETAYNQIQAKAKKQSASCNVEITKIIFFTIIYFLKFYFLIVLPIELATFSIFLSNLVYFSKFIAWSGSTADFLGLG